MANAGKTKRAKRSDVESSQNERDEGKRGAYEPREHVTALGDLGFKLGTDVNVMDASASRGLTKAEAQKRLAEYGPNVLRPPKPRPWYVQLAMKFLDKFMLLLLAAGLLCHIAYALDTSQNENLYFGVALYIIVIATCFITWYQELSSASTLSAIKKLMPTSCNVVRDGVEMRVDPKDIVIGDVVHLHLGDRVPADLRIIHTKELKLENSSLTGESKPVAAVVNAASDNPLEARNIAFSSSLVMQGSGHGVVIRTANDTMIGTIATLAAGSGVAEESLLQKEIHRFVNIIAIFALVSAILLFVIGMARGVTFLTCFVNGFIVVLVANIPEGLAATVTSCLAVVAKRMAAKNVLVKRIDIIESLGACSIIASDKTGTLTQNRMTVENLFYGAQIYNVHAGGTSVILDTITERATELMSKSGAYTARRRTSQETGRTVSPGQTFTISSFKSLLSGSSAGLNWELFSCHAKLLTIAGVNNQAAFEEKDGVREIVRGDATDAGLLRYSDAVYPVSMARQSFVTKFEIPFNSVNKFAVVVVSCAGASYDLVLIKGAPERVIAKCDKYESDRGERDITETYTEMFDDAYHRFGVCGERVIGFAYGRVASRASYASVDQDAFLNDIKCTFVGLISLVDPPRPGVANAISNCRAAYIKVAMVTGDHPLTAEAIARKIGIITMPTSHEIAAMTGTDPAKHWLAPECNAVVVTGAEAENFTEEDWNVIVKKTEIVFARTSPQMKLKFVENLRRAGEIVAVTGDGVNDSPALKAAHIGIAMGSPSSSDVAREAADIVLLDDNFASIEAAVEEGRSVFDNLTKSIMYTLAHLMPQLIPVFFNLALGMPLAMNGLMILSIDLLTEQGPAISLVYEKPESDIMRRKPRNPITDHLITPQTLLYSYVIAGTVSSLVCFMAYTLVFNHYGIKLSHVIWAADKGYFAGPPYDPIDINGRIPPLLRVGTRVYDAVEQYLIYRKASTAWYMTLILNQFWNLFTVRTARTSIFKQGIFSNEIAIYGSICSLAIMMIAIYVPPLQAPDLFATAEPLGQSWLPTFVFAVWIFGISEYLKYRYRNNL